MGSPCWKHARTKRGPSPSSRGGTDACGWKSEAGGRRKRKTSSGPWPVKKSRSEARVVRGGVRAAWYRRWCCLLACSAAKAVAMSPGAQGGPGSWGQPTLSAEVVAATFRELWVALESHTFDSFQVSCVKKKKDPIFCTTDANQQKTCGIGGPEHLRAHQVRRNGKGERTDGRC